MSITANSSFTEIALYEKQRFKHVPRDTVENVQKGFKQFSTNGTLLDLMGLSKMLESTFKDPQHVSEVRKMIAQVDSDKDGKISFGELFELMYGPKTEEPATPIETAIPAPVSTKAPSALSERTKMFESAAAQTVDKTGDNRAAIEAKYAESKSIANVKRAEQERLDQEAAEKARQAEESKKRLKEKAAAFAAH